MKVKARTWAMIFYPESLPAEWEQIVQSWGHPVAISPLHDADIYETGDLKGETKKPHYHVLLRYPNCTTFNKIKQYTDELNQPIPQVCDSIKYAYEYFTHKNAPNKHQYTEEDIKVINGFALRDYVTETRTERGGLRTSVFQVINESKCKEFCDLIDILIDSGAFDLLDYVEANAYFIDKYLSSKRYKGEENVL